MIDVDVDDRCTLSESETAAVYARVRQIIQSTRGRKNREFILEDKIVQYIGKIASNIRVDVRRQIAAEIDPTRIVVKHANA